MSLSKYGSRFQSAITGPRLPLYPPRNPKEGQLYLEHPREWKRGRKGMCEIERTDLEPTCWRRTDDQWVEYVPTMEEIVSLTVSMTAANMEIHYQMAIQLAKSINKWRTALWNKTYRNANPSSQLASVHVEYAHDPSRFDIYHQTYWGYTDGAPDISRLGPPIAWVSSSVVEAGTKDLNTYQLFIDNLCNELETAPGLPPAGNYDDDGNPVKLVATSKQDANGWSEVTTSYGIARPADHKPKQLGREKLKGIRVLNFILDEVPDVLASIERAHLTQLGQAPGSASPSTPQAPSTEADTPGTP